MESLKVQRRPVSSPLRFSLFVGDKDVDGGGGDVHPGLAPPTALQCPG
jgi:hypothetical protein